MGDFTYLPHTAEDIEKMLAAIGVDSINNLFDDIPPDILFKGSLNLPEPSSEFEVYQQMRDLATENKKAVSFLGSGIYDHLIPSLVPFVQSRSEFITAYTPYQAEISQGILQAMFEYQSLICSLTGLDVSNASLYDGASAAAEACAMAVNSTRGKRKLLLSSTVNPSTIEVIKTFFSQIDVELIELPSKAGVLTIETLRSAVDKDTAGVLVQSPNRFGNVENYEGFAETICEEGARFIISSNPLSLGLLKSPGEWGADIAVGDGQPCGLAQNYGGPGVGFICAGAHMMRKMPGRIVGQTLDADGQRAFVLTLQAREQHIKRERATSNICTNQALAALGMAVYLVTMGSAGLQETALQNHSKAHYLHSKLFAETTAKPLFDQPFFNEFAVTLPKPAAQVIDVMLEMGYFAGVPLEGENEMLVTVTEKRSKDEIDGYVDALRRVLV
ncbi:MAG: aminomethyl-transferring glycine dehydrogenase subunit GcvPA [Spirochaetales bacterium]|jgi:glycine dehydrogenase subunit 1|nr:aminomethyl-transferring glycine dehydrogenase subunit GcvPA [Spirochaetales bacterium]